MKFEILKQNIILQCGGLIGAIRLSVNGLNEVFLNERPSENEALLSYFSSIIVSKMARVFGSAHSKQMHRSLKDFLSNCFTNGFTNAPNLGKREITCLNRLQKAGILVEVSQRIGFSSVIAKRYIIQYLFPRRSDTIPLCLFSLIKSCIRNLSSNLLSQSVVDGFPKEATFQHLLMEGLAEFTPPDCSICPELSKAFPNGNQTGKSQHNLFLVK